MENPLELCPGPTKLNYFLETDIQSHLFNHIYIYQISFYNVRTLYKVYYWHRQYLQSKSQLGSMSGLLSHTSNAAANGTTNKVITCKGTISILCVCKFLMNIVFLILTRNIYIYIYSCCSPWSWWTIGVGASYGWSSKQNGGPNQDPLHFYLPLRSRRLDRHGTYTHHVPSFVLLI